METAQEQVASVIDNAGLKAALKTHGEVLVESLERGGLVPGPAATDGLVPGAFKPQTRLEISYQGKVVDLGTFFKASECTASPSISFQHEVVEESDATYTVMMVDPDAPTPDDPKFAFWRHWIVTGLQPLSGDSSVVAMTKFPVTEYHPPGPKADSKPHRYVFLLFREPSALDLKKEDIGGDEFVQRRSFKPAEVVKKFRLELVAVNWMICAADDWRES